MRRPAPVTMTGGMTDGAGSDASVAAARWPAGSVTYVGIRDA